MPGEELIAGREISRLAHRIRWELERYASECDYSGAEGRAMHYLLSHLDQEVYQRDIEKAFGLRAATASQLMKRMEGDGLIVRETSASDARLKRVIATQKALSYRERMLTDLGALEKKLTDGIDEGDLKTFLNVIQKMQENLS